MCMREQWQLHCTSWAIDAIEWVCVLCGCWFQNECREQWICIKFCIKLEHSSVETIWMIQKATDLGNWCMATSSWQRICSCITSCAEFFLQNIKSPRWLSPPAVQIWLPVTSSFSPKLKSPLKGERFQTVTEIQENMMGQLMEIGRTVWGPNVPTLKGTEVSLSYVQCFLYLLQ